MPQRSAGILMYRLAASRPEVLLVHPGGPFWASKDEGAWSIPKGLYEPGEDPASAAKRELLEETGCAPSGEPTPLGEFRVGSKLLTIFALEEDFDLENFKSNTFTMEWPPKSGRMAAFPEADRAAWFGVEEARRKLLKGQLPILAALLKRLAADA
jgi:predicted NUDIX family NTP pyrophosphohydrolase